MTTTCFRDSTQCALACRQLLSTGELGHLWTDEGPTPEAKQLAASKADTLDPGPRALFLATWSLFTGEPTPLRFDELQGLPEADDILSLTLAAMRSDAAVDEWIADGSDDGFARSPQDVHRAAAALFDEARFVFDAKEDEPINFHSAPDACAIGALQVAELALLNGVERIEDEEARAQAARQMTTYVLTLSTAIERERAEGVNEDEAREGPDTEPSPC